MKSNPFSKIVLLTAVAACATWAAPLQADCCDDPCVCWTGFYITGLLGGGWNHANARMTNPNYFNTLGSELLGAKFSFCSGGFVGGGALGYNWHICNWVFGFEGGAFYTDFHKSKKSPWFPDSDVFRNRVEWMADVKGRLGYAWGSFLFFVSGGWAGGKVKMHLHDNPGQIFASSKKWANGWTVGAGADYRIFCNYSLGLEYDYNHMKYSKKKAHCDDCGVGVGLGSPIIDNSLSTHLLLARLTYHF